MHSLDRSRDGDCTCCGAPVSLHYDEGNRRLTCAVACARFGDEPFEAPRADAQQPLRYEDVFVRATQALFERGERGVVSR